MTPGAADLLLVIDVQVDFLPGGALPVRDGDAVVAPINALQHRFRHVVLMQDWHPADHVSFAESHPGRAPFETVALPYGPQVLWPRHCVQGSLGAGFAPGLATDRASLVVRKGLDPRVDSYSAFLEADRITRTGLAGALAERGITRVVLCGLATDFCVLWSALDARDAGFEVQVMEDAVRGIDVDGSLARAWARMEAAGVRRIASAEIA
ncbi:MULTISPECIES: bifunctional nicotinamidase/pyrazinamidase [unclassified Methylobacterium]|uniref:bifunctional nicotinamidase/pyrazinamidase n=1 Tax=unclassified Methylobacterium TaxID=2615210 RepID=UPI0011C1F9D6|nr:MULTISPECIES: bifunctional nicotinamidase/pyrazinamidase [unclassified Methylobacterium]QEE38923.1 bifunctional nicotinamidase/pyrazinamidase [Methylobacterium sp. WL1]TXN54843.1 bifunctional nicotinamidase/pyrazinamidase [Methylobacterium sp. WL2]